MVGVLVVQNVAKAPAWAWDGWGRVATHSLKNERKQRKCAHNHVERSSRTAYFCGTGKNQVAYSPTLKPNTLSL